MIDEQAGQSTPASDGDYRDAGDGEGWNNAVDWLLNSRYMDPEASTHFWHMVDEIKDCGWCYEELKGTNHEIPKPKGYDL